MPVSEAQHLESMHQDWEPPSPPPPPPPPEVRHLRYRPLSFTLTPADVSATSLPSNWESGVKETQKDQDCCSEAPAPELSSL